MSVCPPDSLTSSSFRGGGRLEQLTILNLKGLSRSQLSTNMFQSLQQVDAVAAVFPEMLHCLVIINAPSFFTNLWHVVIKHFVDAKTRELVDIYSSAEKGKAKLLELIDEKELPRDYGGLALSTDQIILREGRTDHVPLRQIVKLVHARRKPQEFDIALESRERVEITIYTRSTAPVDFVLLNGQAEVVHRRHWQAKQGSPLPACFGFEHTVNGPGEFTLQSSLSNSHASGSHHFLVIGEVFRKED